MTPIGFDDKVYNREVPFCRVYSIDSKEKLEKIFLKNRISYFIEWQERSLVSRLFAGEKKKEKNLYVIRINAADVERATELIRGVESVKIKKVKED